MGSSDIGFARLWPRVQTQLGSPYDDCGDCDGELVVASGDASPVLEAAEGPFDQISVAIGRGIVGDGRLAGSG